MERRFAGFLAAHGNTDAARSIIETEKHEISLYERLRAFFGYGYYIAKKAVD
jgi:hypothetical protein